MTTTLKTLRTNLEEALSNLDFARQSVDACTAQSLDPEEAGRRERRADEILEAAEERVRIAREALRNA